MLFSSNRLALVALVCVSPFLGLQAQQSSDVHPPDYRGVQTHIPGVWVTPVPGAPFSGTVEILSKEKLPDGSTYVRHTINHIARNSSGVIYNERRRLVAPEFRGEPRLTQFHIFDPQTGLNTFLDPYTHLARQSVHRKHITAPPNTTPETLVVPRNAQNAATQDLGTETVAGLPLHGTRKTRTVPADQSGTGHEVTITDEYWYSEELKVYLVVKHNDPRTGEQMVGLTEVSRQEPDPAMFKIPDGYKVVDETPVEQAKP
jgi:hypothetical protein